MAIDESTQKVILSLISVIVGWFLGQGTGLIQKWWNNRKLKKALLLELGDIKHRLIPIEAIYVRSLQLYVHNGVERSYPTKLTHFIFLKHYTDIFFKLNHSQRNSYEQIHTLVDAINQVIDIEIDLIQKFTKDFDEKLFEQWGDLMKSQYENIHNLKWHIIVHLDMPDNPDLGEFGSEMHESYVKNVERTRIEINRILEGAKKIKKEDLLKIYDEKLFEKHKKSLEKNK